MRRIHPTGSLLLTAAVVLLAGFALAPPASAAPLIIHERLKIVPTEDMLNLIDDGGVDFFGQSLALNSDSIIVGHPRRNFGNNNSTGGDVRIYDRATGVHQLNLNDPPNVFRKTLGTVVEATDDFFISPSDDSTDGLDAINLYDPTTGGFLRSINIGEQGDDVPAIAVDGNTLVQGHCPGCNRVSVYDLASPGNEFVMDLVPDSLVDVFGFGDAVAISGTTALVGASGFSTTFGDAYLFDLTTGQQLFKLIPDDSASGDFFGFRVALNDQYAVVPSNRGTFIFDVSTGGQLAEISGDIGGLVGGQIALDGDLLALISGGDVFVFDLATNEVLSRMTASDGESFVGADVAIDGDTVIVTAPRGHEVFVPLFETTVDVGAVYVFEVPEPASVILVAAFAPGLLLKRTRRAR